MQRQVLEAEKQSISFTYDPGTPVLAQPGDIITVNNLHYVVRQVRLRDGVQEVEADRVFSPSGHRIQDQVRAVRAMVAGTRKLLVEKFPDVAFPDAVVNELVAMARQAMRLSLAKLIRQALFDRPIVFVRAETDILQNSPRSCGANRGPLRCLLPESTPFV